MSKIDTWACDICARQKKEANHWILGFAGAQVRVNREGVEEIYAMTFGVSVWTEHGAKVASAHLCGIECATKWISKELSRNPEPTREPEN